MNITGAESVLPSLLTGFCLSIYLLMTFLISEKKIRCCKSNEVKTISEKEKDWEHLNSVFKVMNGREIWHLVRILVTK